MGRFAQRPCLAQKQRTPVGPDSSEKEKERCDLKEKVSFKVDSNIISKPISSVHRPTRQPPGPESD